MKNEQKIRLADMVLDYINMFRETSEVPARKIGITNREIGMNGFKKAEVGTPVFDIGQRYMIMLESLDGKRNAEMTYYKETLKEYIEFDNGTEEKIWT